MNDKEIKELIEVLDGVREHLYMIMASYEYELDNIDSLEDLGDVGLLEKVDRTSSHTHSD